MAKFSCAQYGDGLNEVSEYDEFASGYHHDYSCRNGYTFWSDGWGRQLRQESREKWESLLGLGKDDPVDMKGVGEHGMCFADGSPTSHRLPNGMFLCEACTLDWIKSGWLTSDKIISTSFFWRNTSWNKEIDEHSVIRIGGARFPARVIGPASPGYLRIVIGPGMGMLDGGVEADIEIERVPQDLRIPNSEFQIAQEYGFGYRVHRAGEAK